MTDFTRDSLDRDEVFSSFGYEPTPLQREIHLSQAKYRIVACGIRWGKTYTAAREALAEMLVPNTRGWIVAPTYQLGQYAFREIYWPLKQHFPDLIRRESERDLYLKTNVNSEVYVKSATNEDSLIGESLDWLIIDEAARVSKEAYELARGRLVDRDGWMLAISSPSGRNWFEEAYRRGQDSAGNPDWKSWRAPTWTNPFIKPEVLDEIKRTAPERVWRQEYCAEFLDDDGLVFKNVDACAFFDMPKEEPKSEKGSRYLLSWDVGRHQDYSVLMLWHIKERRVLYCWRFQGDWPQQMLRVRETARKYNRADIEMDGSGEGDAVFSQLHADNLKQNFSRKVSQIRFHDARIKRDVVEKLALGLEKLALTYPRFPPLLRELRMYEFEKRDKSGTISYHAPVGYNDDCVMALAIGWNAVDRARSTSTFKLG